MIIGITGQPAAGKDTAASFLEGRGFRHISTGDFLRKILTEARKPTDRQALHNFVSEQRRIYGAGYPTKEILKTIKKENVIFTGLRQIAEVEILRNYKGDHFFLIAIDAPIEKRYAWAKERNRSGDDITFEQFKHEEDQERASVAHQVDAVIALADVVIENIGTIDDLRNKIYLTLDKIEKNPTI